MPRCRPRSSSGLPGNPTTRPTLATCTSLSLSLSFSIVAFVAFVALCLFSISLPLFLSSFLIVIVIRCYSAFSLFKRRHHCRHCAKVFCSKCVEKKLPIPKLKYKEPGTYYSIIMLLLLFLFNPFLILFSFPFFYPYFMAFSIIVQYYPPIFSSFPFLVIHSFIHLLITIIIVRVCNTCVTEVQAGGRKYQSTKEVMAQWYLSMGLSLPNGASSPSPSAPVL